MKKTALAAAIAVGFTSTAFAAVEFSGTATFGVDTVYSEDFNDRSTDREAALELLATFTQEVTDQLTFSAGASLGSDDMLTPGEENNITFDPTASLAHTTWGTLSFGEVGDVFENAVYTELFDDDGKKWVPDSGYSPNTFVNDDGDDEDYEIRGFLYEGNFAANKVSVGYWDSSSDNNANSGYTAAVENTVFEGITLGASYAGVGGDQVGIIGAKTEDFLVSGLNIEAGLGFHNDKAEYAVGGTYLLIPNFGIYTVAGIQGLKDDKLSLSKVNKMYEPYADFGVTTRYDDQAFDMMQFVVGAGFTDGENFNISAVAEIVRTSQKLTVFDQASLDRQTEIAQAEGALGLPSAIDELDAVDSVVNYEVSGFVNLPEFAGVAPKFEARYYIDNLPEAWVLADDKIANEVELKLSAAVFGLDTYVEYATQLDKDEDNAGKEETKLGVSYTFNF